MGGLGSGRFEKWATKSGRYKVFGLTTRDSNEYFYLGITLNYLCDIKSYYTYTARKQKHIGNALFDKIRELKCQFETKELELLPKDYDYEKAKLHLQKYYLDRYANQEDCELTNKMSYCFCPKEVERPHQPEEIKKQICELYSSGVKSKDIAEALKLNRVTVQSILSYKGLNKKSIYEKALIEYRSGKLLDEVAQEYNLSRYMINKLYKDGGQTN